MSKEASKRRGLQECQKSPPRERKYLTAKGITENPGGKVEHCLAHAKEDEMRRGDSKLFSHKDKDLGLLLAVCLNLDPGLRRIRVPACAKYG